MSVPAGSVISEGDVGNFSPEVWIISTYYYCRNHTNQSVYSYMLPAQAAGGWKCWSAVCREIIKWFCYVGYSLTASVLEATQLKNSVQ